MRRIQPQQNSLTGSLLIAHPKLVEPTFRKSVIFMASHEDGGSLGFIMNKPTSRTVGDFIPEEEALGNLSGIPVFNGGPVGRNQLVIALFQAGAEDGIISCQHNLTVEDVASLAEDDSRKVRAFVGHASWGAGQLENELETKAWIALSSEPEILMPENPEVMWPGLIGRMGVWGRLQAGAPDDLSQN